MKGKLSFGHDTQNRKTAYLLSLTDGTITDNDRKYGEWQYKVDCAKKEMK